MHRENYHVRLRVCGFLLAGVFLILIIRLFKLQYFDHARYGDLARNQQTVKVDIPAVRGRIYDSAGRILATSLVVDSVFAEPHVIEDKESTCIKLAPVLGLDKEALLEKLKQNAAKKFIWIKRFVSAEEAEAVRRLGLVGIGFRKESKRFYPRGIVASHVLGCVNIDGEGLEGIELMFDRQLRGEDGYRILLRDGKRCPIQPASPRGKPAQDGASVVLTIDSIVQHFTEEALDDIVEKWDPLAATVVVMSPYTGEILAMANRPTFDPNIFNEYPADARRNRAVTDSYEPGSVLKPVIMAAALEENVTRPEDKIFCHNGLFAYRARRLRDHHPYGWLTASDVIVKSSNIGMAKIGLALGPEKMYRYVKNFGFGAATGIRFPGEAPGQITPPEKYSYYTLTSVPMGQEIAVTALQFARAFAVFGNGGILVKPKLVRGLLDSRGRVIERYGRAGARRVISKKTADEVMKMLVGVVNSGTGRRAGLDEYQLAGKTGTAQKIAPEGGYTHSRFISSFACIGPAEDPSFVVVVMVNEPRKGNSYYGGTVAAPSAGRLAKRILGFNRVRPAPARQARLTGQASGSGGEGVF